LPEAKRSQKNVGADLKVGPTSFLRRLESLPHMPPLRVRRGTNYPLQPLPVGRVAQGFQMRSPPAVAHKARYAALVGLGSLHPLLKRVQRFVLSFQAGKHTGPAEVVRVAGERFNARRIANPIKSL